MKIINEIHNKHSLTVSVRGNFYDSPAAPNEWRCELRLSTRSGPLLAGLNGSSDMLEDPIYITGLASELRYALTQALEAMDREERAHAEKQSAKLADPTLPD